MSRQHRSVGRFGMSFMLVVVSVTSAFLLLEVNIEGYGKNLIVFSVPRVFQKSDHALSCFMYV